MRLELFHKLRSFTPRKACRLLLRAGVLTAINATQIKFGWATVEPLYASDDKLERK